MSEPNSAARELCPNCQAPLTGGVCASCTSVRWSQVIRREIVFLVIIAAAAIPMYLLTRKVADLNRSRNAHVAAYWFKQGQRRLTEGKSTAAIAALREAVTNDRDNRGYAFALAQALATTNHVSEARVALLRLRESAPENPEINLELARLSARANDLNEALQYYHHALYGLWTGESVDERRRQVRLELIHLLLDHKKRSHALAELIVLSADAPRTVESQRQLGEFFMDAGDISTALKHFVQAIQLDAGSLAALAGAGEAAFQLGDYQTAERYLRRAVEKDKSATRAAQLLATTRLIQSSDPLMAHLSRSEQVRRLKAALAQSVRRLQQCLDNSSFGVEQDDLRKKAETMLPRITERNLREDSELLATGAELVFKIEETASPACGEPESLDEALLLVGRKHKASER